MPVNARTLVTKTHDIYTWECPCCQTVNTTAKQAGDIYPAGRCGRCHKVYQLGPPLPTKPPKRPTHHPACARER